MCKREAKGESLTTRYCIGFPEGLACLGCRLRQAVAESASCLLPCCVHCPQTPSTTQQSLQRTPDTWTTIAGMLYIHTYRRRPAPRGESLFHPQVLLVLIPCHWCLVSLGDLCRYQQQLTTPPNWSKPRRYALVFIS